MALGEAMGMTLAVLVFALLGPSQGQATDAARVRALNDLRARVSEPERLEHAFAVEAIMVALARRAGGDRQEWALAGLLHDIDLAETRATPSQHGVVGARLLAGLGFSDAIVRAVQTHDDVAGLQRTSPIEHALYCADRGYSGGARQRSALPVARGDGGDAGLRRLGAQAAGGHRPD